MTLPHRLEEIIANVVLYTCICIEYYNREMNSYEEIIEKNGDANNLFTRLMWSYNFSFRTIVYDLG